MTAIFIVLLITLAIYLFSALSVSFFSTIKPIIRIIGKIQPYARPLLSAAPSLKAGLADL